MNKKATFKSGFFCCFTILILFSGFIVSREITGDSFTETFEIVDFISIGDDVTDGVGLLFNILIE